MPAGRSLNVRAIAFVLAFGVNGSYLLFWLSGRTPIPPEPVSPAMLWILATIEPRPPTRGPPQARTSRAGATEVAPEQTLPLQSAAPAPVPEVQVQADEPQDMAVLPRLDMRAEAARAAADFVRREEQHRRELEPAEEQAAGQSPYRAGVPRKKGENEQLEGGVVRTWVSDLCYYERDPYIAQGAARRVCKIRTAAERLSTHLAEELEKAVKPKYLGGKRELPDEPDSHIRIP